MKVKLSVPARGRPRAFNTEVALERAMAVFWRQGYEGASLPDLTRAMGINRPSLYAAFGNKESLFRQVIERYIAAYDKVIAEALDAPTAQESLERLLRLVVGGRATKSEQPKGCLLVGGALTCSTSSESIRAELASRRHGTEHLIVQRLQKGVTDGDLPLSVDVQALAKFYATVMHGMAVQSASGTTRDELQTVVEAALRAWPAVSKERG